MLLPACFKIKSTNRICSRSESDRKAFKSSHSRSFCGLSGGLFLRPAISSAFCSVESLPVDSCRVYFFKRSRLGSLERFFVSCFVLQNSFTPSRFDDSHGPPMILLDSLRFACALDALCVKSGYNRDFPVHSPTHTNSIHGKEKSRREKEEGESQETGRR